MHLYRISWANGLSLDIVSRKWLTLAEVRFMVHCKLVDIYGGEPHDQTSDNFVRVDIALPRQ